MARVIARGVLSFSIPVDIHSVIEDQSIRMHVLHKKCGSMVCNQFSLSCLQRIRCATSIRFQKPKAKRCRDVKSTSADLIDKMSAEEFQPEKYRERFLAMVDQKTNDKEITVAPPTPGRRGKVVDLMAALKQSLEQSAPQRKPATQTVRTERKTARKRRKA